MEIWAKSDGETLKEHTDKVKEKIKSLIEKVNSFYLPNEGLLKDILTDGERKEEILELFELAAIYHDMGKISPKFQNNVGNPDFTGKNFIEFPDIPHSFLSPAFFDKDKIKKFENLVKFLECDYRGLLKIFLSTIAFHHWRENYVERFLNKWELVEKFFEKFKNSNNYKDFIDELKNIHSEITSDLDSHYNKLLIPPDNLAFLVKELAEDLTATEKNFFILLKGFLHRADHFASSYLENEIEIEPSGFSEVENKVKEEIKRRALEKYNKNITDKDIWQLKKVKGLENKNVFLKATTGVGKTEFALFWSKGKKLIYVLPIRTAVNAMWKRLRNIFSEDKVGLLHSDALFYLEDIREHSRDENFSESFISYELARNLCYPGIVATADQFFTAGLKYPGYEKIYSTLAYSYVVLDEIQLYDPRIAAIIVKTLEEITKLGAKFCIMSATLPD
ncbi:MAG: CRISPR-associated endonuclease Cas3'', partial [Candidatus Aenigmatarchaeota archaeon]